MKELRLKSWFAIHQLIRQFNLVIIFVSSKKSFLNGELGSAIQGYGSHSHSQLFHGNLIDLKACPIPLKSFVRQKGLNSLQSHQAQFTHADKDSVEHVN